MSSSVYLSVHLLIWVVNVTSLLLWMWSGPTCAAAVESACEFLTRCVLELSCQNWLCQKLTWTIHESLWHTNLHTVLCADWVGILNGFPKPIAGVNLVKLPSLQVLHMREHCVRGSLICDTLSSLELTWDSNIARHIDISKAAADMFASSAGLQNLRLQLIRPTLHVSLILAVLMLLIDTFIVVCLDGHYCRLSRIEAGNWYWFMQSVCASCSLHLDWSSHLIQARIWSWKCRSHICMCPWVILWRWWGAVPSTPAWCEVAASLLIRASYVCLETNTKWIVAHCRKYTVS